MTDTKINRFPNLPVYYKLEGLVAKIEKAPDGGANVYAPKGMNIADFMQDGTVISENEYLKGVKA